MPAVMSKEDAEARRVAVLEAARWCFLNFGFGKTSLDDIAKRAGISRTLLYRTFEDKEDIFTAVFAHWLIARLPAAEEAAASHGGAYERLLEVCRVVVVEPWADMVGAPMGGEFFDACERIDPEITARHRRIALACVTKILGDEPSAEVFLLALDGLLTDEPSVKVLERRVQLLAARFAPPKASEKGKRR